MRADGNGMFPMLSTTSFQPEADLVHTPVAWHHKHMVDTHIPTTVGGRIAHVIKECKFPTVVAFAKAVGESPQNVKNWIKRDSFGRSGTKIRAATGVSIDWLSTGEGEPFPNGVKTYEAPRGEETRTFALVVNQLENDIDALRHGFASIISAMAVMRPDEGKAVAATIRANVPQKFWKHAFLKRALDTLDAAAVKAKTRRA